MHIETVHIGIDVSKGALDIDPFDLKAPRVKNTPVGINKLIKRISAFPARVIVCCEATGGYEKLLCRMLPEAGIEVACANALRVRRFAESQGILAKTDAIDARVLSQFSQKNDLRTIKPLPPWHEELKAFLVRRDELVQIRKKELSRLDPAPHPKAAELIREHIQMLSMLIKQIITHIKALIREHDDLAYKINRLCAVNSIALVTAASLLAYIPELGQVTDNQAAALAGLAPYPNDSGTKKGKRKVYGGRSRIRRALYMPAVSASYRNDILAELYQRLISKGKPGKVALTALMRKMVVLANRLMADPDFQIS